MVRSKVELHGFEAKHYDRLLDLITFGSYSSFIRSVIKDMELPLGGKVADFGGGTGRNALLMREFVGKDGEVVIFDIGQEMLNQARKRSARYPNIKVVEQDIRESISFKDYFGVVFTSFVLHGFEQVDREKIVKNAYNVLNSERGYLYILDYNEFPLENMNPLARFLFRHLECELAFEFISMNLEDFLKNMGFAEFEKKLYYFGYVRLLKAKKVA